MKGISQKEAAEESVRERQRGEEERQREKVEEQESGPKMLGKGFLF